MEPLYRRVLGERFGQLPAVWRRFHEAATGGRGSGTFRVTRGRGWLRNLLADLGGLPRAGDNLPVRLEVRIDGARERWLRNFPDRTLDSLQWTERGLMLEAMGPLRLGFRLAVDGNALRYELVRAWFLGVPLPRFLAPRASALTVARDDVWTVEVALAVPLLGEIVRYEGLLQPE
jgi:Domain of unknown function (DUF4166)